MRHADSQTLVDYWNGLRAGRPCPMRSEVDPRQIDCNIGHLFILEDLGSGNIRFRLAGSALVDAFWMELRGMPLHAIMEPEARQSVVALVSESLEEPGIGRATLARAGGAGEWEMVVLPLRSGRGAVDRVLGALYPLEGSPARPANPPLTFSIEEMAITPVSQLAADEAQRLQAGMAEAQAPWEPAPGPSLTSIEGGVSEGARVVNGLHERPRLRLVKDDD